jgi:hypothetical protein
VSVCGCVCVCVCVLVITYAEMRVLDDREIVVELRVRLIRGNSVST